MNATKRIPVTRSKPCPICNGDHKCSVGDDHSIFCGRVHEDHPGFKRVGKTSCETWTIFRASDDPRLRCNGNIGYDSPDLAADLSGVESQSLEAEFARQQAALTDDLRNELAAALGLPTWAIVDVGWSGESFRNVEAWTLAERDSNGRVVGINRRFRDGSKRMLPGSKRGLTFSPDWDQSGPVFLVEGASDFLTMRAMGLSVVGRPSCTGGVDHLIDFLKNFPGEREIVVGENDQKPDGSWPGKAGAESTASRLSAALGRDVRIIFPPGGVKDVRAWAASQAVGDDPAAWKELGKRFAAETSTAETPWPDITPIDEEPVAPDFPLEVLPKDLANLCREIATAANCPVDFPAVFMLALVSGAIAYSRQLEIKSSHIQSASLFVAVVGAPGSGKSPALKNLCRPLELKQAEFFGEHRERLDEWEAKPAKERGKRPTPKRCIVSDVTTESLGLILSENPRGVCLIRDELSAFILGLNQYKGGKGNDRQFYLSLWSNSPIVIDRKGDSIRTGSPTHIGSPFTTILGGIQPDVVPQLGGDGVDDGFFDRFLVSYPKQMPAMGETWDDVPAESLFVWDRVVEKLLSLDDTPTATCLMPAIVRLTGSGRGEWKAFTDRHAAEMNSPQFPEHLRGPWVKLNAYCGRLSLVIHFLRLATGEAVSDDVDGDAMARAAALIDYFKGHLRKVHGVMDADPRAVELRKVLDWIERNGEPTFTKHAMHRSLRKSFTPDELDEVLRRAADAGYIRRVGDSAHRLGRKSEQFEVNPSL